MELTLDCRKTALVLIDLQRGIVNRESSGPRSGKDVVAQAVRLADKFREKGALVVLIHVDFAKDRSDALKQPVDAQAPTSSNAAHWSEIVSELGPEQGDIVILKHQWGAFYGTELDLQLRRRGIDTIVLAGIATNMGVESTARDAYERGYSLVLVEDAMTSLTSEAHKFAVETIFPRIGRVRTTDQVLGSL